jgi:hypothetical protein
MPCTFCDAPIPAGARYCPGCGTSVFRQAADDPGVRWKAAPAARPTAARHAPPRPVTSSAAVASLVFGVLAWTLLPLIGAFVAVMVGHRARGEIRRSRGRLEGDGLAVAGMLLGYIQLLPILGGVILVAVVLALGLTITEILTMIGLARFVLS